MSFAAEGRAQTSLRFVCIGMLSVYIGISISLLFAMKKIGFWKRVHSFVIVGLIAIFSVQTAKAQRISQREARKFMGLYEGKVTAKVRAGGVEEVVREKFRYRARWRGKGSDLVRFEGGSYRPIASRFRYRSNSIYAKTLLFGSALNPDTGYYENLRGIQKTLLRRRGRGKYSVNLYQRILFGSFAIRIVKATGKK